MMEHILRYSLLISLVLALSGCSNETSTGDSNLNTDNTKTESEINQSKEEKQDEAKEETQVESKENIQSETKEDSNDTSSSNEIKITVNYATDDQIKEYVNANFLELSDVGTNLLLLPQENISDFSISYVEYDAKTETFQDVTTIYNVDELSPNTPLVIKMNMPDMPNVKISYIIASGLKQSVLISESGKDGSIYLIEQEEENGLDE
jgi:hypothetical protein